MESLRRISYVSRVTSKLTEVAERTLLMSSRHNNHRDDLTGVLGCSGTHFVQAIEGRPRELALAFERIRRDDRHSHLRVLEDVPAAMRQYNRWTMAYLYSLDLSDEVQALAEADSPPPKALADLLARIRGEPDLRAG